MEVQDFTIPKGQVDTLSISSEPRPTPCSPTPKLPEEAGILQRILYALRSFLVWLVQLIDSCLAA